MDKKRDKTTHRNVIHVKRVLMERMRQCYVSGRSLEYTMLNKQYLGTIQ